MGKMKLGTIDGIDPFIIFETLDQYDTPMVAITVAGETYLVAATAINWWITHFLAWYANLLEVYAKGQIPELVKPPPPPTVLKA